MMITGIVLLRSSESYYQLSGWIVVLTLILPLMPGLFLTIRRYLRNQPSSPENLVLSPLEKSDLEQLSALPVKADWQTLTEQKGRTTLCLHAETELAGFVTGCIDEKTFGYVDGVYVAPKWRRQYWGTTLLDAIHDELKMYGASEVRVTVKPGENRTRSFLHNQFWRTSIHMLTRDESEQTFKTSMKKLFSGFKKEKPDEYELEIPRNLI